MLSTKPYHLLIDDNGTTVILGYESNGDIYTLLENATFAQCDQLVTNLCEACPDLFFRHPQSD